MAKSRSVVADYAVYLFVRFLVCVVQALSMRLAYTLAEGLAWLAYQVDRRHREVAADNLRHAFPELRADPAGCDQMVRACYRHFCLMVVEIMQLPRRIHPNNWRRFFQMPVGRRMVDALLSGRPVMIVTGHFGNWEVGGYSMGLLGFHTAAIARELDNRFLDRFLRRFRQHTGQQIFDKNRDYDKIRAALDRGGVVATLADQDAGARGLFVDFFGRPASTHKAVALLALQHKAVLLVTGTPRVDEPFFFLVTVEDVILPEEYEDRRDAVEAMTQRFTSALERLIRRTPEQYLWLHRRWKHQPTRRKSKQAA